MKNRRAVATCGFLVLPMATLVTQAPVARARQDPAPVFAATRGGGFVPFGYDKRALSDHIVNADGSHYTPGAVDLQFPGPALFPVTKGQLSKAQLADLDQRVIAARLDATKVDYGIPNVADAPSLAVFYRGNTKIIMSWGIGEEGLTPEQQQNRAAAQEVLSWLDVQPTKVMAPTALVMTAQISDPNNVRTDVKIKIVDWPKSSTPLASIGECAVLTGKKGKVAAALLSKQNSLTQYRSKGKVYVVYAHTYVPGDRGCTVRG
jgi:hypothetical protein